MIKVLEVGVGTGRIARPLAEHGFRVCGIDIAPRMLTRLRDQLGPEHVEPDLLLGDATRLPLTTGSFSAAVLCHVLHLIPPWQEAIAEMRRVLKPGGLLLHHGDHSVGESDWDVAYLKWVELFTERGFVRRVRPKIEDMNAAFVAVGGEYRTETIAEWDERSSPAEELELAGNKVHSWTWEIPDELFQQCLPEVERWAAHMLEAAYAGAACVVPKMVAYPEIHSGALVVNHSEIASGLSRLVQEPQFRAEVAQRSRQNAGKYHVNSTAEKLAGLIAQVRQTVGFVAD